MASENETPGADLPETSGNDGQVVAPATTTNTSSSTTTANTSSGENRGRSQPLSPEEEAKRAQQLAEAITAFQVPMFCLFFSSSSFFRGRNE